jgi:cyclopropane fatty-acyl-phospholipid synthase-like methyltransferase
VGGWIIDEAALAGAEHLDPAYVARYDRKAAFDPRADVELLRSLGLAGDGTLVDLGAGTGALALAAAPHCRRVVAVDVSQPMVQAVRAGAVRTGAANIEAVQAGFLSYAHRGDPPNAVYSRNALHHLPDFWKAIALRRLCDMLAAGGTVLLRDLVFSFSPADAEAGVSAWIAAQASQDPGTGWTAAELEAHVRDEHSTFTWLLEPMLERGGFEILDAAYASVGAYAAYTCVRR